MKKAILFAVTLVMILSLSLPVSAKADLSMSNAEAQAGEKVYLTVSLNTSTEGDTMGITYTYDASVLEILPDECVWLKKGVLQDFGASNGSGVWTANTASDLSGDICMLAFQVRSDAKLTKTTVECAVLVKNGASVVGQYQTSATVSQRCEHVYGEWEPNGNVGHAHQCALCEETQTQSHCWDEGVLTEDPEKEGYSILTKTCTVCGFERSESVRTTPQTNTPTTPTHSHENEEQREETVATAPEKPEETLYYFDSTPEPTNPEVNKEPTEAVDKESSDAMAEQSQNSGGNSSSHTQENGREESRPNSQEGSLTNGQKENQSGVQTGNQSGSQTEDHSHDHENEPAGETTVPLIEPIENWSDEMEDVTTEVSDDGHDHDHAPGVEETGDSTVGAIVIALTLGVIVAACVFYYKKKTRK